MIDWAALERLAYGRFRLTPETFWRLMPHEWNALVEGDSDERQARRRENAGWVSLLLSAQCGKQITAGQLLGEEPADEDINARALVYERELEKRLKREKRRKVKKSEV